MKQHKRLMRIVFALLLVCALGVTACGDDGGTADPGTNGGTTSTNSGTTGTNNGTTAGTNNGTTAGTNNGTTTGTNNSTTTDTNNGTTSAPCGGGCAADEECINDQCVPIAEECEQVADDCEDVPDGFDPDELLAGDLICLPGDSTDAQGAQCHEVCNWDPEGEIEECAAGSLCVPFTDNEGNPLPQNLGYCLQSNCDDPSSTTQCADVGTNGGTCNPLRNDTFYCFEAGTGAEGSECTDDDACGPGTTCFNGICEAFCELDGDSCGADRDCLPLLAAGSDYGVCGDGCPGFATTDECGEGFGCLPLASDIGFCTEVGETPPGEACTGLEVNFPECAQFSTCTALNEGDDPSCVPWCDFGADENTCPNETDACLSAFEGLDSVGLCFPGCTPFVSVEESGCETEGVQTCFPVGGPGAEGLCFDSGDVALGEECEFVNDSIFGSCEPGGICLSEAEGDETGTCFEMCRPFASADGLDSGCGEGEICGLANSAIGTCTSDFFDPPIEPLQGCPEPGNWCDEDVLCFQADDLGNGVCIALCRLSEGDADCGDGTICDAALADDELGICLPQ